MFVCGFVWFYMVAWFFVVLSGFAWFRVVLRGFVWFHISDGSGPKKSSPGRAQALNVKLGPGPGLSPSLKARPRAGRACPAHSFTN